MKKPALNRRTFLKAGAAGVALAAAGGVQVGCCASDTCCSDDHAAEVPYKDNFQWQETTAVQFNQAMEAGELTAVSLTQAYLERIEQVDKAGPAVNAVLELNPDALRIAEERDKERAADNVRGPLHGIPVLIKGNIDTADQMTTTAGSLALAGTIPAQDAPIVKRMREAGVVLLGKANLSEWANFRSLRSSSGWSSQGRQTKNPYVLDRNPCGSSSGSGVAASTNLCAIAVGTETDGSIVCPSNANGLVGIKPTVGLLSRTGIVPISHTQDTAGPMARCVADSAALLTVMAGGDPSDSATAVIPGAIPNYAANLDPGGLRGMRIGVSRNFFGFHEQVDRIMEEALAAMKDAGAVIVDPANIETRGDMGEAEWEVLLYEFKHDLNAYLAGRGAGSPMKSLADLIAFNNENADRVMPYFQQEIFELAEEKGPLTEEAYIKALDHCRLKSRDEGIDATLRKHKLDAIVTPTGGPAWKTDRVTGDHFIGGSSEPAAVSGYPSVTVPAGFVFGLPVGISFTGAAWQEAKLIRIAYGFEQATKVRKSPTFLPTLELD